MEIVQRTGNPILDARARIEYLSSELRELKRQLANQSSIPVAISRIEADIAAEKERIQAAKRAEKAELEEELKAKQRTAWHGELMVGLEKDADGVKIYTCSLHPGRKISQWLAHVSDFDMHPFKENSALYRRQQKEKFERADAEQKAKADKAIAEKLAEEKLKKQDYLRKNGFRVEGPIQY